MELISGVVRSISSGDGVVKSMMTGVEGGSDTEYWGGAIVASLELPGVEGSPQARRNSS